MTESSTSARAIIIFSLSLFLFSIALTAYSAKHPKLAQFGSKFVNSLILPAQKLWSNTISESKSFWKNYFALVNVKKENQELKSKLTSLSERNYELEEIKLENDRLRELLNISKRKALKGVYANVIAYSSTKWNQEITIDVGEFKKIKPGMAVVEGGGVVGQVISITKNSSRVLLISDPNSGVDAIIQGNRARGILEGRGAYKTRWSYVLSEFDIKLGARIITSGLDGIYPKGLLLGVVSKIRTKLPGMLFQIVEVQPAVDFNRLENVLVVLQSVE